MKKKYSLFRELWAVPKYQILIKLGAYLLFFIIFFTIASIGNNNKPIVNKIVNISYSTMKKQLLEGNLKIKYNISSNKSYYLEGTIIDNIISSTLEYDDILKKINIIEDKIFIIQKNEQIEDSTLLRDINLIYLYPENIFNILNQNPSLMRQSNNGKIYNYSLDNKSYSVFLSDSEIEKIVILDGMITYTLEYSLIK